MARYSIDGQILTDIADAIRGKTGMTTRTEHRNQSWRYHTYDGSDMRFPWPENAYYIVLSDFQCDEYDLWVITVDYGVIAGKPTGYGIYSHVIEENGGSETLTFNSKVGDSVFGGWTYRFKTFGADGIGYTSCNMTFKATYYDQNYNEVKTEFDEEVLYTYAPEDMASEIINLPEPTPPGEDDEPVQIHLTGDCSYRFAQGGWDWVIKKYGDTITSENVGNTTNMFTFSNVDTIPFEINCNPAYGISYTYSAMNHMFNYFYGRNISMIHTAKPNAMNCFANNAQYIREFPEGFGEDWNWEYMDTMTSAYGGDKSAMFEGCYSLRKLPMGLLAHGNPYVLYSYNQFNSLCESCYALDEIINIPNPHYKASWTESSTWSNAFADMVKDTYRLKNFTFAEMAPQSWAYQLLDFSSYVGYAYSAYATRITNYNSGITADKKVTDDASYQALKNDPDWWTTDVAYSRYNHDSAVATINSLPDCAAYQSSSGKGANTIKFTGNAGSATDGGAINTLTDEEIAVAAAKGWTVTFA